MAQITVKGLRLEMAVKRPRGSGQESPREVAQLSLKGSSLWSRPPSLSLAPPSAASLRRRDDLPASLPGSLLALRLSMLERGHVSLSPW